MTRKTSLCGECFSTDINFTDLVYLPLIEGGRGFPWCSNCGLVLSSGKPTYQSLIDIIPRDSPMFRIVLSLKQSGASLGEVVKFLNEIKKQNV